MKDTFKTNRSQFANLLSVPGQNPAAAAANNKSPTSPRADDNDKSKDDKDKESKYMLFIYEYILFMFIVNRVWPYQISTPIHVHVM